MSAKIGDAGYRIIGPIASGGMGEVYKAEHVITRRVEAIKFLSGAGTAEDSERFLREIQLQASLSHPNIAAVYNAFRVNDDLVMVMELVDGEPLRALLARARISLPAAVNYACQALGAIAYAHAHGVVHRDITPANIIITPQGVVKLTDFGLAKTVAPSSLSQSGSSMGSPHYMSPEQVKDSTRASARSDIYSLGAVLYEMVAGKKMFEGDSSFSIMQAQVESPPVPPIEIQPSTPLALNQVILTALEKDPERRFASADAFRLALEGALAPPLVPATRAEPAHRRFPVPYLRVAAICAVALPIALILASGRRHPAIPLPPPLIVIRPPEPSPQPVTPEPMPEPQPAPVENVVARPAIRQRTRITRAPQRNINPTITRQEPVQSRAIEPLRTVPNAAVRAPEPPPPTPEGPENQPARLQAAQAVAAAESEAAESSGAPDPAVQVEPASTQGNDNKKPRHRVWRALGKILGPFH